MENKATIKRAIPARSGFPLLDSLSRLLPPDFRPPPYPPSLPSFPGLYESIMQNKPNSRKDKTNTRLFAAKVYQRKPPLATRRKQSQSNPIPPPRGTRYAIRDTRYEIRDTRYDIRHTKYEIQSQSNPIFPPIFQNLPFRPGIYHRGFASPNFPASGIG